ncbi:MAG: copper resistance system multicopper oxidase [Proteobacteria bacterium]|nr:copper resistance system multicopper oxidase [Pseudomonadota bacterium]
MKIIPNLHPIFVHFTRLTFICLTNAYAAEQVVDLNVGYKTVGFAGKCVEALAVNNQIPAPTLHFKEGDQVTINVHNHLQEGTTIHWHGILLPWNMDGVEGVTQEAIPPGGVFSYKFRLKQSGTYWYHSHAGFQEQQGIYGGFIIDPLEPPAYPYTKDYVIVLSDWSNMAPDQIFANLKKDGDYYTPDFPLQPSLARFISDYKKGSPKERQKLIDDYEMMQKMRMSIYDISDVAYDAFLLNGHPQTNPWTAPVQVGDTVRLRFVGAGGSTIFRVKIPGTSIEVVHIQGHDVVPYFVEDFTIAPGETTDVLVKIEKDCPYVIYAESSDSLGAAYGALLTHLKQAVDYRVDPFPTPQPVMMGHGMMGHGSMDHESSGMNMDMKSHDGHQMDMSSEHASMNMKSSASQPEEVSKPQNHSMHTASSTHSMDMNSLHPSMKSMKMDMSSENTPMNMDSMSHEEKGSSEHSFTMGTKYQNLKSPVKTNDPNRPFQEIKVELSGYMNRFMWFINGLPEYEAEPIRIEPGKRYRLVFTNTSMMHHPMHIHGHFFILRNGHGEYDPFLHTIEVPPGATVVADFDADAHGGQWFFHCHHLYHMMAGMAQVFRYSTIMEDYKKVESEDPCLQCPGPVPEFVMHPMAHHPHMHQSTLIDMGYDPYHNVQKGNLDVLVGWDKHRLQFYSEDAEIRKGKVESADLDVFYWHLLSEFWAIKGGANYFYKPSHRPYWQPGIGIEGMFPYFIDTNFRTYLHEGSVKFDLQLSRDTQFAHNLYLRTGLRGVAATHAVKKDQIGRGLNYIEYIVRPYIMVRPGVALYTEFDFTQDYGNLKKILHKKGKSTSESVLMVGISVMF